MTINDDVLRADAIAILKREGWSPRQINRVISTGRIYTPAPSPNVAETAEMESIAAALVTELNARDWAITYPNLTSKMGTRAIAAPRGAAMWLVREILGERASFPAIGKVFGRDHSTVMHAVHIRKWREIADDRLDQAVAAVLKKYGVKRRRGS